MTSGQAGSIQRTDRGASWPTIVASLAAVAAFFALWFLLLPTWLDFHAATLGAGRLRWIAAVPSVLGFTVALRCVWDFAWTGRGSPAPFAPPQRLVVVGFYRHVRNPIYVGAAAGWIGFWIVLGHASLTGIIFAVGGMLGVHSFVVFYEEPTLRKKFGVDYEEYCRNVRRWWPRVQGWDKPE